MIIFLSLFFSILYFLLIIWFSDTLNKSSDIDSDSDKIEEKLKTQNDFIGSQLKRLGIQLIDEKQRAPHFLGAILPKRTRPDLISKLAEKNIYVSERGGTLRITPHLWNSKSDFEKLISELGHLL